MEIRTVGDKILYGTAHGISLVLLSGADDILRKGKFLVMLVPALKKNIFPDRQQLKKVSEQSSQRMGRPSTLDHLIFISRGSINFGVSL